MTVMPIAMCRMDEKCSHGVLKRHIRHTALQNGATPLLNCSSVELSSPLHADGRIVDALNDAMRAFFQQPFYVRPAAAAAIQHLGIWCKS